MMSLIRKIRHLPYLAVTLSAAALSAAALVAPSSAAASGTARLAGPGPKPAVASAIAAYFWSGDNNGYYTYDSAASGSGTVTMAALGTGDYEVTFANMGSVGNVAVPQVTTYGSNDNCAVTGWSPVANALQVNVSCSRMDTGALDNAEFDLVITRPTHPVNGTFDYSLVSRVNSSGKLTSFQYNSSHKSNSVRHLRTGQYQVTLGGPRTTGTHGIVKVTAFGAEPGDCELESWSGSAKGEVVNVGCYRLGHVAQNREFIVTYATASSLMAINGQVAANAFANTKAAVYQPADQYDSTRGAKVTVVHYATGSYEVLPAGSSGNVAKWGGDVQVNAVDSRGRHCFVVGWSQQLTPSISISCVSKTGGQPVDSPFTVEWVVP